MTFITILVALSIERFFHWSHLRNWRWYRIYQDRLARTRISQWPSSLILVICVLPPVLLVGLIDWLLFGFLYGIPQLIFGVLVLLYCMGPSNLWFQTFGSLHDLNAEDPTLAVERAQKNFRIQAANDAKTFHRSLTRAIFLEANQRIFAVIFWFILLGPMGAVLYRAITLCSRESSLSLVNIARQTQGWLDWLPIRIFTLLFALGGHFVKVFRCWKQNAQKGPVNNDELLASCGVAALDIPENNEFPLDGTAEKSALDLLDRSFVIGLIIFGMIALMTFRMITA